MSEAGKIKLEPIEHEFDEHDVRNFNFLSIRMLHTHKSNSTNS